MDMPQSTKNLHVVLKADVTKRSRQGKSKLEVSSPSWDSSAEKKGWQVSYLGCCQENQCKETGEKGSETPCFLK